MSLDEWLGWSMTSAWGKREELGLFCEAQKAALELRVRFLFNVKEL